MMLRAARGARDRAELDRPNGEGYAAECSISPDGRHVLYAYMDPKTQDVDVWVYDTRFGAPEPRHRVLVRAKGYDGGPFFSPDGKRICYRSDREGNNELQLFVADLVFGETGQIIGVDNERRLTTQGGVVNWAPFWSRDGRYLIYASSALGHRNYELFAVDVSDPRRMARVTAAAGFDGLPAFSDDGSLLMWTSQRGPKIEGEARATSQLWLATVRGEPAWREAR
jgi:Tol biopolymer transport system component